MNRFIEEIGYIDDKFILQASPENAKPLRRLRKRVLLRRLTLAACICLVTVMLLGTMMPMLRANDPPIRKNFVYTADEIGALFGTKNDSATSSYTKVYFPTADHLKLSELPSGEYIEVYDNISLGKLLSRNELSALADPVLARFASEVGRCVPEYEIERVSRWEELLRIDIRNMEGYSFYATQTDEYNAIDLSVSPLESRDRSLRLGGVRVEVDQRLTDGEIIASLGAVKEKLFSIFGAEYSDIKIVRDYDGNSDSGVRRMYIYFYNESDHPLNSAYETPVSDHIYLYFDNMRNYSGDIVRDDFLTQVSVHYKQYRTGADSRFAAAKRVGMITLSEAEELLYRGYVFGGHSCPLCMAAQERVDFHGYDFADMIYVSGYDDNGGVTDTLPFYRFFKEIGTSENGNLTYAMTYVPAVRVTGYDEYFEKQSNSHGTSDTVVE